MIIEFISTPGAGKTTLLPVVADWLNSRGYRARTVVEAARPLAGRTVPGGAINRLAPSSWRRPLLWQVFYRYSQANQVRFFARHQRLFRTVWAFQLRRPISPTDRRHVMRWFHHQAGVYEFLRRQMAPDDAVLFDEGFVHRVVQLFASERETPEPGEVRAYLDLVPRPDLIIHPAAPLDTCEERIYARGLWDRFQEKSAVETSSYLAAAECAVALALDDIRRRSWPLLVVDNSGADPAAARAELRRALPALIPAAFAAEPIPAI